MSLSVIIPVGGLTNTDPHRRRAKNWILDRYNALLPDAEFCLAESTQEPYNRSEARNLAFKGATGDILLVADADTVFNRWQIDEAVRLIENGAPWVIPYRSGPQQGPSDLGGYYNLTEAESDLWLRKPPDSQFLEPSDPAQWDHKLNSFAGLLVLPRSAWEKVGGYNEAYHSWGGEDVEMRLALDSTVGPHRRVNSFACHLWHERGDADFSQPEWPHNAGLLEDAKRRYKVRS